MTSTVDHAYDLIRQWALSRSIEVHERDLPSATVGEFNGVSVAINQSFNPHERACYLAHALGSIVCWSLDKETVEEMFHRLRSAKAKKETDPESLEQMLTRYREFEEESSAIGARLLVESNCHDMVGSYTNLMRADLEAMTQFHRHGEAPVWPHFFSHWNEEVANGRREVPPFSPKCIPRFTPIPIEKQIVLQRRDAACDINK